jgi:hypothetical protein
MIVPGATAITGLPMAAGKSMPPWNVPASGLPYASAESRLSVVR